MFICVIFKISKVIKVVPISWRRNNPNATELSYGIRPNKVQTIFYSPDETKTPNFGLPLSIEFDGFQDQCYLGYILKIDGQFQTNFKKKLHIETIG